MSLKIQVTNNNSDYLSHLGLISPDTSYITKDSESLYSSFQKCIFNGGTSSINYTASELLNIPQSHIDLSALIEEQTSKVNIIIIYFINSLNILFITFY